MAKGLRSSVKKANKARLRTDVFGPAELARKERLSAKLSELAMKPGATSNAASDQMEVDSAAKATSRTPKTQKAHGVDSGAIPETDDMDLEMEVGRAMKSLSNSRRRKDRAAKDARRKPKNVAVFPAHKRGVQMGHKVDKMKRKGKARFHGKA